jgi:hypothetical protein
MIWALLELLMQVCDNERKSDLHHDPWPLNKNSPEDPVT